jgi:hypothetical protein
MIGAIEFVSLNWEIHLGDRQDGLQVSCQGDGVVVKQSL